MRELFNIIKSGCHGGAGFASSAFKNIIKLKCSTELSEAQLIHALFIRKALRANGWKRRAASVAAYTGEANTFAALSAGGGVNLERQNIVSRVAYN